MEFMVRWTWNKELTIWMLLEGRKATSSWLSPTSQPEVSISLQSTSSFSTITLQTTRSLFTEVVELPEQNDKVIQLPLSPIKKLATWLNFQPMWPKNLPMIQIPKILSILELFQMISWLPTQIMPTNSNRKIHKFKHIKKFQSRPLKNSKNAGLKLHNTV